MALTHATEDPRGETPPDNRYVYRGPLLGDVPKISPSAECGACDPTFKNVDSRFQPLVFSRGLLNFADTAISGGHALTISATPCDSALVLWDAGVGEDGSGQGFPTGWKLTPSDTNAGKQGRIVPQDYGYVIAGIAFRLTQPAVYSVVGSQQTLAFAAWTDAFVKDMQAVILEHVSARLVFGKDGEKSGALGNLGQWGQFAGLTGSPDAPTNGTPFNNQYLMMWMGAFTGGTEDLNQVTVELAVDEDIAIQDPTNPEAVQNAVSVAVECQLIGYYVCPDDLGVCAPAETQKLAKNLKQLMAADPTFLQTIMAAAGIPAPARR